MKKKNNSLIVGIIVIVVLALVFVFAFTGNKNSSENNVLNTPSNGVVSNALDTQNSNSLDSTSNPSAISANELGKHNSKEDCWIAYSGKVYDVTAFLPKHAGSAEAIIPYCGTSTEFEEAFLQKHGTAKASMLMKVGVLIGDFENKGNLE